MSILRIAVDQIRLKSWWNAPQPPWQSNQASRRISAERREALLITIRRSKKPIFLTDLADRNGIPLMSARKLCEQLAADGLIKRQVINGQPAMQIIPKRGKKS